MELRVVRRTVLGRASEAAGREARPRLGRVGQELQEDIVMKSPLECLKRRPKDGHASSQCRGPRRGGRRFHFTVPT